MSEDRRSRIDRIAMTYERRGSCAHCARSVKRQRTFQGRTLEGVDVQRTAWEAQPLLHPACEPGYENALIRKGLQS